MRFLVVALMIGFLTACGNPRDAVVPTTPDKWGEEQKKIVEKLTEDEKKALMQYMMRASLSKAFKGQGFRDFPAEIKVGDAIKEQQQFEEERKKKEVEAQVLKEKAQRERAELVAKMDAIVVVSVTDLRLRNADQYGFSKEQVIKLALKNKSDRDINGLKGNIEFYDMFDKKVGELNFKYEDGIKAGETANWIGVKRYNEFLDNDRAISQLEEGKYKAVFIPEAIVFRDGEKLKAPE